MSPLIALKDPGDRLFIGFGDEALTLRRYQPRDEEKFEPRPDFARALEAAGQLDVTGYAWTLCRGTRHPVPIAIGGVTPSKYEPGKWDAWAFTSDMPPRAWVFARICANAVLEWARRAHQVDAIWASCPEERPQAKALLEALGFAEAAYGRGPDTALYHLMRKVF